MTDDPIKPPRFPYVATLLCAACVSAAAWTWMRYSYAWDVTAADLSCGDHDARSHPMFGRYVVLNCTLRHSFGKPGRDSTMLVAGRTRICGVVVRFPGGPTLEAGSAVFTGRVVEYSGSRCTAYHELSQVDTRASRFHGASVAGLVVGAMGVFVFTVALRHWLGERRKIREKDEGA